MASQEIQQYFVLRSQLAQATSVLEQAHEAYNLVEATLRTVLDQYNALQGQYKEALETLNVLEQANSVITDLNRMYETLVSGRWDGRNLRTWGSELQNTLRQLGRFNLPTIKSKLAALILQVDKALGIRIVGLPQLIADITNNLHELLIQHQTLRTDSESTIQNNPIQMALLEQQLRPLRGAQTQLDQAQQQYNVLQQTLAALTDRLNNRLQPASLDPLVPLALFPVHLETRYVLRNDGTGWDLLIRVYPDQIHLDNHNSTLTEMEIKWGQHFWNSIWNVGNGTVDSGKYKAQRIQKLSIWTQLVDRFGLDRASWISHQLRPTNQAEQPIDPSSGKVPDFPKIKTRDDALTAPLAKAQGLPERWVVRGYQNSQLKFESTSGFIPDPLPMGFLSKVPANPAANAGDEDLYRWMVDFEAAFRLGMGFRIERAPDSLDLLLVFGIKADLTSAESSSLLETMLDIHHYTSGLSLIAQGTPTNNTPEARSAFSSSGLNPEARFDLEITGLPIVQGDNSDGDVLSQMLGWNQIEDPIGSKNYVPRTELPLASIQGADGSDQRDAAAMNELLWPATWGYFLGQMLTSNFESFSTGQPFPGSQPLGLYSPSLSNAILDGTLFEAARRYFIEIVHARGPLPAIRVGSQPYGILPISSFTHWQHPDPISDGFVKLLRNFLEIWRIALPDVPHMGRTNDPNKDLIEVLSQEAISANFAERRLYGANLMANLYAIQNYYGLPIGSIPPNSLPPYFYELQMENTRALRKNLQIDDTQYPSNQPKDRLGFAAYDNVAMLINGPMILPPDNKGIEHLSESEPLQDNYIRAIAQSSPSDLASMDQESVPLLCKLLRHAVLWAYAETSYQLEPPQELDSGSPSYDQIRNFNYNVWREPELVDINLLSPWFNRNDSTYESQKNTLTALRFLEGISQIDPKMTRGDLLYKRSNPDADVPDPEPTINALRDYRKVLLELALRPTAVLDRLMRETLDLSSYRLDAWITSLMTNQLNLMRLKNPVGIHIGGYGWVTNLSRRENQPVSEGLIHAPSIAHATAAAVLYSGYLSHNSVKEGEILSLDVSSKRARMALDLIDGVRQDQSLAALLGYRFERSLHEAGLAQYTTRFRQLAPLVAGKLTPSQSDTAVEGLAADNVVDGLKLLGIAEDSMGWGETQPPTGQVALPPLGSQDAKALHNVLGSLRDALDAVSDVLVAESVYQVARGNPLRTGGTIDSISRGETPPSEVEVLNTPRTGIGLTHRLVLLLDRRFEEQNFLQGWLNNRPRALAEPVLNAWVGQLLGPANQIKYSFQFIDGEGQPISILLPASLNKLFCPLDLLYTLPAGDQAALSELEQRLIYEQMSTIAPAEAISAKLIFTRGNDWEVTDLSLVEALEIARAARDLISRARPFNLVDLTLPGKLTQQFGNLDELTQRTTGTDANPGALRHFKQAVAELRSAADGSDAEKLRGKLLALASYDIPGSIPIVSRRDDAESVSILKEQAQRILKEASSRQLKLEKPLPDSNIRELVAANIKRLQILFGEQFVVLPQFDLGQHHELATNIVEAVTVREQSQDTRPVDVIPWLERIGNVREGIDRFNLLFSYADATHEDTTITFHVAQLSANAQVDKKWIAHPLNQGEQYSTGQLSLVIALSGNIENQLPDLLNASLGGLFIDEWIEVVPDRSEISAMAFHFDAPGARAPQSILMAVHPIPGKQWDWSTIADSLLETVELAKIRGIDPHLVVNLPVGQYIPALILPFNLGDKPSGDTISTTFRSK